VRVARVKLSGKPDSLSLPGVAGSRLPLSRTKCYEAENLMRLSWESRRFSRKFASKFMLAALLNFFAIRFRYYQTSIIPMKK
jgi:hypothetical protein